MTERCEREGGANRVARAASGSSMGAAVGRAGLVAACVLACVGECHSFHTPAMPHALLRRRGSLRAAGLASRPNMPLRMAFNGQSGPVAGGKKGLLQGLRQALGTRMNYSSQLEIAEETKKQDFPDGPYFQRKQAVPQGVYQSLYLHQELVAAICAGNVSTTRQIVQERNADPNFVNPSGWTALHWAVQYGQTDVVSYLLEEGADCSMKTVSGHTALHRAAILGDVAMAGILVEEGGADVRASVMGPTEHKDTSLHLAAMFGHQDMVTFLRQKGADVFAVDARGVTARERALSLGMFHTADQLALWEEEVKQSRLLSRIEGRVRNLLGSSLDGEEGVEDMVGAGGEGGFLDRTPMPGQKRAGKWNEASDNVENNVENDDETFWEGLV